MNAAVVVAVIAGAVSAAGWLVNYVLTSALERRRVRLTAHLSHIERQLEELYGPLSFLMLEGKASFQDLLQTLGRRSVFIEGETLSGEELELWLYWVDHDFMPRNAAVQSLLSTKAHLIVGANLPKSYIGFLDHYNSWRVTHDRWRDKGISYSWHSKVNWPTEFEDDVLRTFEDLMRMRAELIGVVTRGRAAVPPLE
jgi:hypothetical protein